MKEHAFGTPLLGLFEGVVKLVLARFTCRYSPLIDQFRLSAISRPPPAVQPYSNFSWSRTFGSCFVDHESRQGCFQVADSRANLRTDY